MEGFQFPLGGGRSNPNGIGERESDKKEISIQVLGRSGPDYNNLAAYIPSHFHKVATLGTNDPTVVASRKRLGGNMAGQDMDWTTIKAKVQELYDRGKLAKWCGTPEGAQAEIDKCWKYFNSVKLG